MRYIRGNSDFSLEPSAVTLGKFDGLHTGHQKLIQIVSDKAEELGLLKVLFTFDSIPLSILPQKNQHFISTNTERKNFCESLGIDVEIEYPFTVDFMNMEPEAFIEDIIVRKLNARVVVVGTDYRFGKGRAGDVNTLVEASKRYGFEAIVVEKEKYQDREISSSFVREELKLGHMETVNVLLNRPYSITGIVSRGNQLGRTMDFPTMNIYPSEEKLLPPNGVYASIVKYDDKELFGVTNLGTKPTVSDGIQISVETYIFDFNEEMYGKKITVCLMHFLRPEMCFEDVSALKKQMVSDTEFAKSMFLIQ